MKQRIFNRGKGWYIPCSNYKDQNDKAYLNVKFGRDNEPLYTPPQENDYTFIDIVIDEGRFNSYEKKVSTLFVYKWHRAEQQQDQRKVELSPEDLPFY